MSREALEEERDFLLASIRDLEAERTAGDIDEVDYLSLRDQYTVRAAAVLRALDAGPESGPSTSVRPKRRLATWVTVVAVLAVAGAGGALVTRAAGERLPGDQVSGTISEGVTGQLARAQQLIGAGKASEAVKVYDEVLKEDPDQPEALAYRGWIVHLAGLSDRGLEYEDRAIRSDPTYPDAHFFRGMILWRAKGDAASAVIEFQAFLDNNPPPGLAALVKGELEKAKAEAAGSTTSTSSL